MTPILEPRPFMFLVLRWLLQSVIIGLLTRGLGRFFPILKRLLRVLWP